jgi:hypothetical protein
MKIKIEHIMDISVNTLSAKSSILNQSLCKMLRLTVLSLALQGILVPLVVMGTSSVVKAEEFKPKQLIAQSCRNIEIRTNGKSRTFRRGISGGTCGYSLRFQSDGNLILINSSGQPLWATGTDRRGESLSLQADGNLVIYGGGRALWATNTDGNPGAFLAIQADGNLVVYRSDGQQALWASGTDGGQFRTRNASGWNGGSSQAIASSNGLPTTTGQANNYMKTQYYSSLNPDGPSGSRNCGPTSVAILRKLFGKEPSGISVQGSINQARYQLMNAPGTGDTDENQLKTGIANSGLRYDDRMNNGTWAQLDRDLADGKAIIAWGYYDTEWRNQFPNYRQTGGGRTDHINTILGKTANGNYIVGDPMYTGGAVEMNRDQLSVYFTYGGGGHDGRPYYLAVYR